MLVVNNSMPKWLYRYIPLPAPSDKRRNNALRRLFCRDKVSLSDPLCFNDPFDCQSLFRLKGASMEDWQRFFSLQDPNAAPGQIARYVSAVLGKDWEHSGFDRQGMCLAMRRLLKGMRIICLSERWDSILMWSHYADRHRGLCLQFDAKRLAYKKEWCPLKVVYRRDYPSLAEFLATAPGTDATRQFALGNKAAQWRYEREWRFIAHAGLSETKRSTLPRGALRGVMFGCQVRREGKRRVLKWIEDGGKKDLAIYDLVQHPEEYRVKRRRH